MTFGGILKSFWGTTRVNQCVAMTNHLIHLSLFQILTFFWASASWTLQSKPSLIENQSLKKASSHLPHDLSGQKLSCPLGDGVANVLTLVHSSLCVVPVLLEEGGSIKTPSSKKK